MLRRLGGRVFARHASSSVAAPSLKPLFAHSQMGRPPDERIANLVVENTGETDALDVTIEPMDLGAGVILVASAGSTSIGARQRVAIELREQSSGGPAAGPVTQAVDLLDRIEHASVVYAMKHRLAKKEDYVRSWPVRVRFRSPDGEKHAVTWTLTYGMRQRHAVIGDGTQPYLATETIARDVRALAIVARATTDAAPPAAMQDAAAPLAPDGQPRTYEEIVQRISEVRRKLGLVDSAIQAEMAAPFFKRRYPYCQFLHVERLRHKAMLEGLRWTIHER
jgi:hypothetical protein